MSYCRRMIKNYTRIYFICLGFAFIFKFLAIFRGWQIGLWDRASYPIAGIGYFDVFHCLEQVRISFHTSNLASSHMNQEVFQELGFSLFVSIFSLSIFYFLFPFGRKTLKIRETISYIKNKKNSIWLKYFIISFAIFFIDFVRYYFTSIFPFQKSFYTWSSFCISGPEIFLIDKIGSLFESFALGAVYLWIYILTSKKMRPAITLFHADGECGQKSYGKFWNTVGMGGFMGIVGGVLIWVMYLPINMNPNDRWYALTPIFALVLFLLVYVRLIHRTIEAKIEYKLKSDFFIQEIETRHGKNSFDSRKIIKDIPADPTERYLGRLGFETLVISLIPIFASAMWLVAYLTRFIDRPPVIQRFFQNLVS